MTYGELFIGLIIYTIIVIITAEILYKKNKNKYLGFDVFMEDDIYYNKTHAYLNSMTVWFIIILISGVIIKVITDWNEII